MSKKRGSKVQDARILKLPVSMPAYKAMTGRVGGRGFKGVEVRRCSNWNNSRIEGRDYDFLKLYGGVNYCSEKVDWTLFELKDIKRAGREGSEYIVPDFGGDEFDFVVDGEVWLIRVGDILDRHYKHQGESTEGKEEDHASSSSRTTSGQESQGRTSALSQLPPQNSFTPPPQQMPSAAGFVAVDDVTKLQKPMMECIQLMSQGVAVALSGGKLMLNLPSEPRK